MQHCRIIGLSILLWGACAWGADWPQWRGDSGHRGVGAEQLPAQLHLQWTRQYSPRVQTWDNALTNDLITNDQIFEPVIAGGRMFLSFNDCDKIVAIDLATGKEAWTFYTEGPVRLPPAVGDGKVYVASDDGWLYCLDAATGKEEWRHRGGPSARKCIGNGRMISLWPVRGGPVVHDGVVYYAAGVWPFVGVFIHALDSKTGKPLWVNDTTGSMYTLQGHAAAAFAGVAPQGGLAVAGDKLLVPGGRTLPAVLDRRDGKMLYYEASGVAGGGGSFVMADAARAWTRTSKRGVRTISLADQKSGPAYHGEPVVEGDTIYIYGGAVEADKPARQVVQAIGPRPWEIEADATGDLIKSGSRLYAAGKDKIIAIDLPATAADKPRISWSAPVSGTVMRLLAGGGRLVAVTLEGQVMVFGAAGGAGEVIAVSPRPLTPSPAKIEAAKAMLARTSQPAGFALVFGIDDIELLAALAQQSALKIVAVDPDESVVAAARKRLDEAGLYGRIAVAQARPEEFKAPPYVASLIVTGKAVAGAVRNRDGQTFQAIYQSLRPYGGAMVIAPPDGPNWTYRSGAAVPIQKDPQWLYRNGPLKGSGDWTGQYADAGNTVMSADSLVKLPLAPLWFGGPANARILSRHGRGPPEQVAGGRVVIEGVGGLTCYDAYTGTILWDYDFGPDARTAYALYWDDTDATEQGAMMGANVRGTNYVITDSEVYVALGSVCRVLDAASGKLTRTIEMPKTDDGKSPEWGFIGLYDGLLIGGQGFADYSALLARAGESKPLWNTYNAPMDKSASRGLVVFRAADGKVLWKTSAASSFIHNAIVAGGGRIYCLDKLPAEVAAALARRGRKESVEYRIAAFDARSGKELWQAKGDIFGSWLSYSAAHDVLLQATDFNGARAMGDRGNAGMVAYRGKDGGVLWKNLDRRYMGPVILRGETILTNGRFYAKSAGAIGLLDGTEVQLPNPISGQSEPWLISRSYGCNYAVGSEHLLTFRSASAGYYDLATRGGTGNFGGFRSGCTANLVPANGVLSAPDYTRGCSCVYQNQASLAMVHAPDVAMEQWTANYGALNYYDFTQFEPIPLRDQVNRVGINFGAPGDHAAADGTLWLDWPAVGGSSYDVPIKLTAADNQKPRTHRRHESAVAGELPFVAASCIEFAGSIEVDLMAGLRTRTYPVTFDKAEKLPLGSEVIAMRFEGIDLPAEEKIIGAYVQCASTRGGTPKDPPVELTIQAGSAGPSVTWTVPAWVSPNMDGLLQRSSDLTPLLQDLPGKKGAGIILNISGKGSREVWGSAAEKSLAPRLVVTTHRVLPAPPKYTVRLIFAKIAPQGGGCIFDVSVQGKKVLESFDVARESGGAFRSIVKEFKSVEVRDKLKIDLTPRTGTPLISGVEIIEETEIPPGAQR
ncbi:MAG: PQQ-binding-like beta-propeller repeat protein [Planctomycetaceae bacterium]|nr:PQQ-binding-like beta-propeller repeat protein [Planctomycetaceae bacterium]